MIVTVPSPVSPDSDADALPASMPTRVQRRDARRPRAAGIRGSTDADDEEEDLGDEEDLSVAQPAADEDSAFDDFDDEFDDDFEEEEDDPDWDHPDDGEGEPPPGKPPGRKK